MTAIELYTKLIEKHDRTMNNSMSEMIKAVPAEARANAGGYFLNESLNNSTPLTNSLCGISRRLFPSIKIENEQVKAGWSVIRPLYVNDLIGLERESVRVSKDSSTVRANLFQAWKDSKSNKKRNGDWTPKMFRELDNKDAKDFLWNLFLEFDAGEVKLDRNKIYNERPKEWTGYYHNDEETGISFGRLITNANKKVKEHFVGRKVKPVLDAVNKLQSTTLYVNQNLLERLKMDYKAIEDKIKKSCDSLESYRSKQHEFKQIIKLATDNETKEIYSSIYLDTRGRTYYGADYLNRSGSDLAKALLMVEPEEIGDHGWDALLIAAIDFRAKDKQEKLSRAEKLAIGESEVEEFVGVANGDSYFEADEMGQYLAVCIDIRNALALGVDFDKYKSGTLLSRDASQSGPMLMGIATQDENTMKFTNVLKDDKRYDLYEELGAEMLRLLKDYDVEAYDNSLNSLKFNTTTREGVSLIYENEAVLKAKAKEDFIKLFSEDKGALRKWSKYPLMLFGYSAEQWCIANDLWNKFQFKYDWLTPVHVKLVADLYYEAAKTSIPAVYQFMEGLKKLASEVHKQKTDLLVHAAYSHFPFMQNYYRKEFIDQEIMGKSAKNNGGKKERIVLSVAVQTDKRNYHKTRSGTPANAIHSIDSDLLKMVVNEFPHDMATNHDAFFATPGRIDELDVVLRECTMKLGTEYNLLGNITKDYNLTPEDIGIKINPINPKFNPLANEYCYS